MTARTLRVAMDDILDAMTIPVDYQSEAYLDLRTGDVVTVMQDDSWDDGPEDDNARRVEEDPQGYAQIPRVESRDEFDLMCRFADSVDEDDIQERLALALRGKGAFSRFRDVVFPYPDLKSRWFATRQDWLVDEAKRWLAGLGIEAEYQLRPTEATPARPTAPSAQAPHIDLLDVLLLGAPDGKTELIGGRVLRQVSASDRAVARQLFKGLARGICDYFGVAWRKRYIERKDTFDLERAHLRLEGTRIVLEIEVPQAIWRAFE